MSGAVELPPSSDASREGPSFVRLLFTTPLGELVRGRVTGATPSALPSQMAESSLPPALRMFIDDVIAGTRLWRSEKREIARELAAHFADGLDAGRTADQLIKDFGDPSRAALLMRRAAKRNRPWPWQAARFAVRASAVFIIALIGLYAILTLRFYLAQQGPIADFRPAMNAAALSVNENDRAWPLYRQALLAMPDRNAIETTLISKRGYQRLPHPGEEGWEFIAEHVEKWAPAFEFARQAADKSGLGLVLGYPWSEEDQEIWPNEVYSGTNIDIASPESAGIIEILLPHLSHLRNLAMALGWDFERAVADGEGDVAVANAKAMLGIARHARENPTLISALVSISVSSMTCEKINHALAHHPEALSDENLTALAHLLAAFDDRALQIDYSGERLFFEDVMQRVYSDDGDGDGRVTARGLEWLHASTTIIGVERGDEALDVLMQYGGPLASTIMLDRRAMIEQHDRLMGMIEDDARTPLWEREKCRAQTIVEQWISSPLERLRHYPLTLMLPALGRASVNAEFAMMRRDATLTAIALELHRRRNGRWPTTLAELTPQLLPEPSIDRFNGQALKYALRDGEPLLYSVGTDREDDGGTPPLTGEDYARLWHPRTWIAEQVAAQKPVITGDGRRILYWDGDWILWPPQDEGPLRRDYPATVQ